MLCALGVDVIFIKPIPKVKRGKCGGEGTENTSIVDIASQIVCVYEDQHAATDATTWETKHNT